MEPTAPHSALFALRTQAEQRRLAGPPPPVAQLADMPHLANELHLHQLELEIQYEELLAAQARAQTSQLEYADLYNSAPVGYCTLGPTGTLSRLNHCAGQLLGRPASQLLGHPLAWYVLPTQVNQLAGFLTQLHAAPGQRHSCELALRAPGGQRRHVQVEGVAVPAGREAEVSYQLVLLDVSARRAATEALAAREARVRATFEQSADGRLLLDHQRVVAANDTALRLLGLADRTHLLDHSLAEFWPATQPDGQLTQALLDRCLGPAGTPGGSRLELLRYQPGGQPAWDELSFSAIVQQGKLLLHVAWRDITARKQGEQQLLHSQARLEQALAAADTGAWCCHLATGVVEADSRVQRLLGLPARIPLALLKATVHPADLPGVQRALVVARREHGSFDLEYRLLRADGSVRHVAATACFAYDARGRAQELSGLVRDVTARRRTEDELTYRNRLLQNLLRSVPVVLARIGADGRFREYAGPPLRRLGLADNELVGRVAADEFPSCAPYFRRLLAGEPVAYLTTQPASEAGGAPVHFQVFGFFDLERQEGVLFSTDISETTRLKEEAAQARLRQQQELITAVLDAQETERSRIAESLHNGLGQLLYATRLQLDAHQAPGEAAQLLNEAIRQVRVISHELSPALLEDHGLAAALHAVCQHMSSPQLYWQCHLALDDEAPPLPPPLQLAIYRLAQELTQNVVKHAQARHATLEVDVLPGWVVLRVEDDGRGFDPDQASDGLGLRTLRSRVALLGGTTQLDSAPGQGTQVLLRLPLGS